MPHFRRSPHPIAGSPSHKGVSRSAVKRPKAPPPPSGTIFCTRAYPIPGLTGGRHCSIWLPPGYFEAANAEKRYPVAYLFDGQNVFGDEGSFSGGWYFHEALAKRAARKKVVPIVVALHHGGVHRTEDLIPWGIGRGHRGRADHTLDWMVGTLRRFVAEDLRVLQGPEHTLIGGSSLGGLAALYAYARHPDVFGRVLAMSPSLWVHRGEMLHLAHQLSPGPGTRIYVDAGGREGAGMMHNAHTLARILAGRGFTPGVGLMWRPDKRGSHNERNWRRRLPKALRYLYDGAKR